MQELVCGSSSTRIDCDVAGWNVAASGRRTGRSSTREQGGGDEGCWGVVTSGAGGGGCWASVVGVRGCWAVASSLLRLLDLLSIVMYRNRRLRLCYYYIIELDG